MSKRKTPLPYPEILANYSGPLSGISLGKLLATSKRLNLTESTTLIVIKIREIEGSVDFKLVNQIANRQHLYHRYILLKRRYTRWSKQRLILIHGNQEGLRLYHDGCLRFDTSSDTYFRNNGITDPVEISKIRKERYDSNSLEFFISKYGDEEGRHKYQDNVDHLSGVALQLIADGKMRSVKDVRPSSLEWWITECGDTDEAHIRHAASVSKHKSNTPSIANLVKSGMTEEEANLKFKEGSVRCVEHWMKRGYSEAEAIVEVARVSCRSLEFFVNKYGKEEGRKRWDDKCSKWAKSYYSKSSTEIAAINKSKGGGQCGVNLRSEIPQELDGLLYLIQHKSGFLKIGITQKKSVRRRYQNFDRSWNIVFEKKMSLSDAFKIEQDVIERFKPMAREYDLYYSKETFHKAILGDIVRYVNQTTMKDEDREFLKNCSENAEKRVCFYR
jgi:hypothetical protein